MKRWMMNFAAFRKTLIVVIGLVGVAACAPQFTQSSGYGSWIDKPLANSTIPLAAYQVISHANSPEGIAAFELSVDGAQVAMNDVPGDQYGESLAYIAQLWNPSAPGVYELTVRAMDLGGEYGPSTSVMVTVADDEILPADGELPAEVEPTATEVTPAEEPPADALACTFEAVVNIFCRTGPDTRFEAIDSFTPGQMAPVVGMSTDGFYWYVLGPLTGRMCTVPSAERYGVTTGDCSGLARFTPMPTPANTPTSTVEATATATATPTVTPIPPPK